MNYIEKAVIYAQNLAAINAEQEITLNDLRVYMSSCYLQEKGKRHSDEVYMSLCTAIMDTIWTSSVMQNLPKSNATSPELYRLIDVAALSSMYAQDTLRRVDENIGLKVVSFFNEHQKEIAFRFPHAFGWAFR